MNYYAELKQLKKGTIIYDLESKGNNEGIIVENTGTTVTIYWDNLGACRYYEGVEYTRKFSLTKPKKKVKREVLTVAYIDHVGDNVYLAFDNTMWSDILKTDKERLTVTVSYETEEGV